MTVGGPLPQVVSLYLNQVGGACPADDPVIDRLAKELGKDRDDIEAQHFANNRQLAFERTWGPNPFLHHNPKAPVKDLQFKKTLGRVNNYRLTRGVYINDDRSGHGYQVISATFVCN